MAYSIIIKLAAKHLILYRNGLPLKYFLIGIGKTATPTPAGMYYIANKRPNPGGPFGVMWLGLNQPHYGIHGTNNPASIGHLVSHGCIRMYNRDVLELARFVSIGTPVRIIN
ncbi:MAG TPA: L,D-transpeptidase [Negativicutes bacterium]|jgi:lipoprotein-anchoring transpeptidase ErfK/SrfK